MDASDSNSPTAVGAPADATPVEVPQDASPAIQQAALACTKAQAEHCLVLGVAYQNGGHGLKRDDSRAADLYQRTCELGEIRGCNNLAVMLEKGEGRPRDLKQAFAIYDQGCAAKHALACRNLGRFLRDGLGVAKSATKATAAYRLALELSKQACAEGEAEGCSNIGWMYRSGNEGVPKDEKQARSYLKRACDMGYRAVCSHVQSP